MIRVHNSSSRGPISHENTIRNGGGQAAAAFLTLIRNGDCSCALITAQRPGQKSEVLLLEIVNNAHLQHCTCGDCPQDGVQCITAMIKLVLVQERDDVAVGAGVDGDGDGGVPQDSVHSGVGGSKQWHHSRFVQFLKQEIREAFSLGSWCSPSYDDPLRLTFGEKALPLCKTS